MKKRADLLVRGGTVVSASAARRANVVVRGGAIVAVVDEVSDWIAAEERDATGCFVLPGLIDAHNHPYYDEDIGTFSRSAAAGGITTLIPFVAGSSMSGGVSRGIVEVAAEFADLVRDISLLDCGAHAILSPGDELVAAVRGLADHGVRSAKVFFAFPGVRMLTDDAVFEVLRAVADSGGVCMAHCENGAVTDLLEREFRLAGRTTGSDYIASRPVELEAEATYRFLSLARLAECPAYVVHISAAEVLDLVRRFRAVGGPPVFAETCLHYLALTAADQVVIGPRAKISPPFRRPADRDRLWQGVRAGDVDVVSTDASGQLRANKDGVGGDYLASPYGIPGVEEFVRVLTAEATTRGIDPLPMLANLLAERPARIFGLRRKGCVEVGYDADLSIFDPTVEWTVRADAFHGRSDYSLYEGASGKGAVVWTCQRGRAVLDGDVVVAEPGRALFLEDEGRT
ncbi:MAG: amidohydrolase family protein [Actinomycetota bacterium]|nr:amidohydrolase family protein [Actinomycetota bacterium]